MAYAENIGYLVYGVAFVVKQMYNLAVFYGESFHKREKLPVPGGFKRYILV